MKFLKMFIWLVHQGIIGHGCIYLSPHCVASKENLVFVSVWAYVCHCTAGLHRGAFCQFPFRWIYYCHSSKSTERKLAKRTYVHCMAKRKFIHISRHWHWPIRTDGRSKNLGEIIDSRFLFLILVFSIPAPLSTACTLLPTALQILKEPILGGP